MNESTNIICPKCGNEFKVEWGGPKKWDTGVA